MRVPAVPRWRDLDQVRRADVYLRSSLYLLLWGVPLLIVASGARSDAALGTPGTAGVALLVVVLTCVAGTATLREVIALHPRPGPLPRRSLAALAATLVLGVVVARLLDPAAGSVLVVVVGIVVSMAAGGLTDRRAVAGLLVLLGAATLVVSGSWPLVVVVLAYALFLAFTVRSSLWLYGVITELDRTRRAQAALAVAEERLRFSRDVHDVMGRRLSTIAVQAELASTLARRGDERAVDQMLEVRAGAHEALREARELARGYRSTDLAVELEGARSLLASAGIACHLAATGVPERWREPAAWVVREAVTNVLRHSQAREVRIGWDGSALTVADDGGTVAAPADGSGLRGLRERVEPLGARLEAGPTGDGFAVTMRVGVA
ncbi:hypothetical protein GCM10009737_22600 [Nocardioides lentus]|uniref:Signal transduction histidine kinase subgroup 3 dimerisation and phosphoacceptor domain-containing protein n=1 Tax=Nocardioides lentus TaxID=338077 RepID=A0ABN2PJA0_9ACTN